MKKENLKCIFIYFLVHINEDDNEDDNKSFIQIDFKSFDNMTSLFGSIHYSDHEMKREQMKEISASICKKVEEEIMIKSMDMERKNFCIFYYIL